MFISINYNNKVNIGTVISNATTYIVKYNLVASDIIMNQYLIDNYKIDLKSCCLDILNHAKLNKFGNDLSITFDIKKYDLLAALITYGNGAVFGSKLLVNAIRKGGMQWL